MAMLIIGLVIFVAVHFVPRFRDVRRGLIARFGEGGYKAAFSIASLIGFGLIVYGYGQTEYVAVYDAPSFGHDVAHLLMPFAFLLAAGANMRSNLKSYVRHPLSWAVVVWAVAHLSANGDLASLLLFGGLGLFAAANMIATSMSEPAAAPPSYPRRNDIILVGAGLVASIAAMWAHGAIFGVYVI